MPDSVVKNTINAHPFLKNPIFAFGSGRCGSTLLRSLVDGHDQVLCWPFEFPYYSIYKAAMETLPVTARLGELFSFFKKRGVFQHIGADYNGDLGSRRYITASIQSDRFFNLIIKYANERVSRKEFLQFIIFAYHQSLNIQTEPSRWFITLMIPSSEPLEDFSDCKAVVLTRNPIDTYVSVKRFYFKGAELTGRDKCSVYRPRAADRNAHWGLLETAVYPILSTFHWLESKRGDPRVMQLFLEKLRENPAENMRTLSDFCGIDYRASLLKPTFLGLPHFSNLSSGKSSGGAILPQHEKQNFLKDLTIFECLWVNKLFYLITRQSGYPSPEYVPEPRGIIRLIRFIEPLLYEFPSSGKDNRWEKQKWVRFCVRAARWCLAPIGYIANRAMMLFYSEQKNRVSFLGK